MTITTAKSSSKPTVKPITSPSSELLLHKLEFTSTTTQVLLTTGYMVQSVSPEHILFAGQLQAYSRGFPNSVILHSFPFSHDIPCNARRCGVIGNPPSMTRTSSTSTFDKLTAITLKNGEMTTAFSR